MASGSNKFLSQGGLMNFHLYKTHLGLESEACTFLDLPESLAVVILSNKEISARLMTDVGRNCLVSCSLCWGITIFISSNSTGELMSLVECCWTGKTEQLQRLLAAKLYRLYWWWHNLPTSLVPKLMTLYPFREAAHSHSCAEGKPYTTELCPLGELHFLASKREWKRLYHQGDRGREGDGKKKRIRK